MGVNLQEIANGGACKVTANYGELTALDGYVGKLITLIMYGSFMATPLLRHSIWIPAHVLPFEGTKPLGVVRNGLVKSVFRPI